MLKTYGHIINLFVTCMLACALKAESHTAFTVNDVKSLGVVGALTPVFLQKLAQTFNATAFVETGTYLGETTENAAKYFQEVHTIELDQKLYEAAFTKFAQNKKVYVYQGDSTHLLPEIVDTIKGTAVFWLDGHYSCGNTAKGELNTPILAELETIARYKDDAIILIDDVRFFQNSTQNKEGTNASDYPDLTEIIHVLDAMKRDYKYLIIGDVLLAYPSKYAVAATALVQACTVSRLFGAGLYTEDELVASEGIIARARRKEARAIQMLCKTFGQNEGVSLGLASYYFRWYGLMLQKRKGKNADKYLEQAKKFNNAYFSH